jgi:hypothetical protein
LIAQGKLDLELFTAAPLLGAYVLAVSDTSAVINMTVARFGTPGWTFEIESLVKKAQPVFSSATEAILAASYEIPELRHMKGATVNRNDKTIGLPTGKLASLKQRMIDGVNAPSSPQGGDTGATATVTPAAAPPATQAPTHMSYTRWMRDTTISGRRGATLGALDDAVKDWGNAQDYTQLGNRSQRVRDALGRWQVETGDWEGSPVNRTGAVKELLEEINRPIPSYSPPASHMTHDRWMRDTAAGVLTPRSAELKALDLAVKAYDDSMDDTHEARKADVRDALAQWKLKQGPGDQWRSSARNKLRAVEILDAEVRSSSAPVVLTQQEKDALEAIDTQNRENLARLFKDKRLVPKTTTAIDAVATSLSTFKTLRDSATQLQAVVGAPDTAAVQAVVSELFDGDGPAARAALGSLFHDIVAAASPLGAVMVANDWKGAVQAWQAQKKSRAAGTSFAAGDPTAAFDAMMKILERETVRARQKAAMSTAKFVIDTVLKGTGVGAVATPVVDASKALVDLFVAVHHLAIDSAEAAAANTLIAQGKLDLELFTAAPLLGAYVLAVSDTSAVINMTVARFGAPGWTFEIESLVKKAEPVFASATEAILAASYEIREFTHMKGTTVNRNDKTIGLPTGKIASLKQRVIDWVNAPSSPQGGGTGATASTGTATPTASATGKPAASSTAAPTHMSYTRWMKETTVTGRRGATLRALDEAVKDWGNGQDYAQLVKLRQRVRDALGKWQVEEGDWLGSPVNAKGAVSELLEEINRPSASSPAGGSTTPGSATSGGAKDSLYSADLAVIRSLAARAPEGSGLKLALSTALEASKKVTAYIVVPLSGSAVRRFDERGSVIGYDVRYQAGAQSEWQRVGNLVHELTHVAVGDAFGGDFVNYANAGKRNPPDAVYRRDAAGVYRMTNEEDRQMARMNDAAMTELLRELGNLRDLAARSGLDEEQKRFVVEKIDYGRAHITLEYDTVVNQMIVWCAYWQAPTTTTFYTTLDRLAREAYARRQSRSDLAQGR